MKALVSGDPDQRRLVEFMLYSSADVNYMINVKVASWLANHISASDTIFIWGFEPFIYYRSQRKPASRYIYNVPQRTSWSKETARKKLMEDLDRNHPVIILVEHNDIFPWVTGNSLDSAGTLQEFPELQALIDQGYARVFEIEDFAIYRRKEGLTSD